MFIFMWLAVWIVISKGGAFALILDSKLLFNMISAKFVKNLLLNKFIGNLSLFKVW